METLGAGGMGGGGTRFHDDELWTAEGESVNMVNMEGDVESQGTEK